MRRLAFVVVAVAALSFAPGALAAGWCGSGASAGDRPDVVTGPEVHAIVALPADAPDTFATDAGRLADDTASLTSWWIRQDPTRSPRLDVAPFGAQTCLDISFVRLPLPASAYTGASNAFRTVTQQLDVVGFGATYKDYLVYFDGPSVQENVCGTGGGQFDSGPGYAVVWLQGCTDVPSDSVAAHELLHAFGALPDGAPHACPGDAGHPCDSPTDVLYPYSSGAALASQVLDVNHDDYYAHSGNWLDIQDSSWLHRLDVPPVPLALTFSGEGRVTSNMPGVDCTSSCTTQWDTGLEPALTAQGTATTRFVRWSGGCSGIAGCDLLLAHPLAVTAVFGPRRIPVLVQVAGKGAVTCSPKCSRSFAAGNRLVLHAVARKGWRFTSWGGGCSGARTTCVPATDFPLSVRAVFRRR